MGVPEPINLADACAVCGTSHDGFRALQHLPPSWVLLLADEYELHEQKWNTAFVELCEDCQPRFDYLKKESWKVTEPLALDAATRDWALRIKPDDIIHL